MESGIGEMGSIVTESCAVDSNVKQIKKKKPRRILHFSDGTLEEYSTDEDDVKQAGNEIDSMKKTVNNQLLNSDPKTMYWSSWFWYHIVLVSSSTLGVCDYLGEKLAEFFGITSPKYEYEIDYYNSIKAEEEEQKKQRDLEMGGWTANNESKPSDLSENTLNTNVILTGKERF